MIFGVFEHSSTIKRLIVLTSCYVLEMCTNVYMYMYACAVVMIHVHVLYCLSKLPGIDCMTVYMYMNV